MRYIFFAIIAEIFIIYASVLVKITSVSPIMTGFYRTCLSLPIFFLFALKNKELFKLSPKDLSLMILSGLFFGSDLVFFNHAIHHTSVANVNLIGSLVCFILVPIGIIFFHEKIKKQFIIGGIIALFGVFVLIKGEDQSSIAHPFGDFLAFLSMCSYAIFLSLVYKMRRKYHTMVFMFYSGIGASLLLLIVGSSLEGFSLPQDTKNWFFILLIALFGQILGQGFFGFIMGKISTQTSSLLLLLSPITAAIMGFFILGEKIGLFEILGIGIILFGVYLAKSK